jgi:hypothetical protein
MEEFWASTKSKIIIAITVFVVAVPIIYFFVIFQAQRQEQKAKIDLQNRCSAQAKKVVDAVQITTNSINYTYKSHYSFNLGRCYVLIHGIGVAGIGTSDELINVFTDETVANCESYSTAAELDFCSYNGSDHIIYNISQFDDFVKPFMETE